MLHARRNTFWFSWPTRLIAVALAAALAVGLIAEAHAQSGGSGEPEPIVALPALGADLNQTSVSGISSGAYMAGQFQFAHSRCVFGAAIFAGGPYGCAHSAFGGPFCNAAFNLQKAVSGCMLNALAAFGVPSPRVLARRAERLSEQGDIDPIATIKRHRVYLFAGAKDLIVRPAIVRSAAAFYRRVGVADANIRFIDRYAAGHAFVTETEGAACGTNGRPFVVDCDYDQAGDLLRHLHGALRPRGDIGLGRFITFDQTEFTKGLARHGLDREGKAYIPDDCRKNGGCRIHIAFHGCDQARRLVGDVFVGRTGFAQWAATNRLVVLFPQIAPTAINLQACWDWWGYTGRAFLTRSAVQITAVHRMREQLSRPRPN
ncbi:MAG: poly(3-hydroxybutyrate) depolymerase [Pseudomonadota bacterium]